MVIGPEQLEGTVTALPQAMPNDRIPIRIVSNRPAQRLLLVYDVRLEHENPLPKLARRILEHLQAATLGLEANRVGEISKGQKYMPDMMDAYDAIAHSRASKELDLMASAPYWVEEPFMLSTKRQ